MASVSPLQRICNNPENHRKRQTRKAIHQILGVMKKIISLAIFSLLAATVAYSQTTGVDPAGQPNRGTGQSAPAAAPREQRSTQLQQRPPSGFDLSDYGVTFQTEPRLMIMMAALEAAGFDPVTADGEPSVFRAQVRRDLSDLDPDLRSRLRTFYERNKLPAPATAADQAARYVSLAFALGPPPLLDAPARSEELPSSLLEVLDFAPLVREFYRSSKIEENLVKYSRAYQAEGDRLRKPTAEMIRGVLSYLYTRPIKVSRGRVPHKSPAGKKNAQKTYTTREHQRRFFIVTDLLGAPGAINFRVIGDEYYAVLPEGTDPASSELRRAYLQYVVDPVVLRFNREIAARRDQIKLIITERETAGATVSPDVFLAVSRSLVAAADARYEETRRIEALHRDARARLATAINEVSRLTIAKDLQVNKTAVEAETARFAALVKKLAEIEQTLRLKDYNNAESRLKDLLREYSREPRIFFALAQTASLAAADAIDEDVQTERLNRALGNYRLALEASSPETDRALVSRAHEAMGRIHAFLENKSEAAKEFDEAIRIGNVPGGAYKDALEGRKKLPPTNK